jgi:hypothetical protein
LCLSDDGFPVPEGYVLQHLEVTDGKIAMPKNWFYHSGGTASGWLWTFSKEDPAKGPYETGLSIQLIAGVEKKTKQPSENFAKVFLDKKRSSAKVLKDCAPVEQGDFKLQCLEVIEDVQEPNGVKSFHILYSVSWGMDMVVINTFGAPPEQWESVKPIADVMANIELIGPNFGK